MLLLVRNVLFEKMAESFLFISTYEILHFFSSISSSRLILVPILK